MNKYILNKYVNTKPLRTLCVQVIKFNTNQSSNNETCQILSLRLGSYTGCGSQFGHRHSSSVILHGFSNKYQYLASSGEFNQSFALQLLDVGDLKKLPALVLGPDGLQLVAAIHLEHVCSDLGQDLEHVLCGVSAVVLEGGGPDAIQ